MFPRQKTPWLSISVLLPLWLMASGPNPWSTLMTNTVKRKKNMCCLHPLKTRINFLTAEVGRALCNDKNPFCKINRNKFCKASNYYVQVKEHIIACLVKYSWLKAEPVSLSIVLWVFTKVSHFYRNKPRCRNN